MLRKMCQKYLALLFLCPISLGGVSAVPARAAQEIVLISDQSKIIKLPQPPATLVVGNPAVADVTTDGSSLFFHPRGYGLTNVLALDGNGKKLGDYLVRVIFEDSYSVSMYDPAGRRTFTCRKDCEPNLRIGDEEEFFSGYTGQVSAKNSLASSQAMGEDMLVPSTTTNVAAPGVPIQ